MKKEFIPPSKRQTVILTLIAWLAMIGFDFFLHAGLLAKLYLQPSPFLLTPAAAFALIPMGYFAFLLLTITLIWLSLRLRLTGWREGAIFGLKLGSLTSGSFMLGLFSISTASLTLLLGWFFGQVFELAIAGAVIGSGLSGVRLSKLFGIVVLFTLLLIITTIVMQTLGIVPATRMP